MVSHAAKPPPNDAGTNPRFARFCLRRAGWSTAFATVFAGVPCQSSAVWRPAVN